MKYTLASGKEIKIPDIDIEKSMKNLELTKEEAIQMWLEDNDYEVNDEQIALDNKAKMVKIDHGAKNIDKKSTSKPRTVKISDEKKELFDSILQNLTRCVPVEQENITVLKENKLIEVRIGDKTFKIDIIETRNKKK